jgi:hypothetical protein
MELALDWRHIQGEFGSSLINKEVFAKLSRNLIKLIRRYLWFGDCVMQMGEAILNFVNWYLQECTLRESTATSYAQ